MFNFTKNNLNDLFTTSGRPDYSVIVTELRDDEGHIPADEILTEIKNACSNLLAASYVANYCEKQANIIICYINYDASVFSIRAFVGSLRQTMYSISQKIRSFVFYSEGISSHEALLRESAYLCRSTAYGLIFGSSRPITGNLLHSCDMSSSPLGKSVAGVLDRELAEKKLDRVIDHLGQAEKVFTDILDGNAQYCYAEMLQYISDINTVLKIFFSKQNYHFPFTDENLTDLLYKNNGCVRLLVIFRESMEKYAKTFAEVPASLREQKNMQEILKYISEHLSTASLSDTAAHFDLTDAYLCRLFKKNMGINFTEYIKEKKLETALRLLQSEEKMTVSSISQAVGMKSQSHFQNMFKNEFGITPEAYRRNYRLNKPE